MKDSFAGRFYFLVLIALSCLGAIGEILSGRTPFIASNLIHTITIDWIPVVMAIGLPFMLLFHRAKGEKLRPRKLIELYAQFGWVKASCLVAFFSLSFYFVFLLIGDAGLSKVAVYLSDLSSSKPVVLEAELLKVKSYSPKMHTLQWLTIELDGRKTGFSFPAVKLNSLQCSNDKIRISGNANWAGVRVNTVECDDGRSS